jgi:hypothetical protein
MAGVLEACFVVTFLVTEGKSVMSKPFVGVVAIVVVVEASSKVLFLKA